MTAANEFFSKRFRILRLESKLTQEELADKLKVSRGCISHWEQANREPNLEALQNISSFFHVSTEYLIGKTDLRNIETVARYIIDKLTSLGIVSNDQIDIETINKYIDYIQVFNEINNKK